MLKNELDMSFSYEPVTYGEIKCGEGIPINENTQVYKMLKLASPKDLCICDIFKRLGKKESFFTEKIIWEENILNTITAKSKIYRGTEKTKISKEDIIHAQTFPEDYDFCSESWHDVAYACGMSVPPVMIKRIVQKLIEQGVYDYVKK